MNNHKNNQKSLNNGNQIPYFIILIAHTLQLINHSWATKFAIKLFRTPIRFKNSKIGKIVGGNC